MKLEIVAIIVFTIIVCCMFELIIYYHKHKNRDEKLSLPQVIIAIIPGMVAMVSLLPYMFPISMGKGKEITIYYGNVKELENMENNYAKTIKENAELKISIMEKEAQIDDLLSGEAEQNEEIEKLREASKYIVTFKGYSLFNNGAEIIINKEKDIAMVGGNIYFSEDAVQSILNNSVNKDENNNILYIGKYPEETIDLLSVCEPYDLETNWTFISGKKEPYKIQSKILSDGFVLCTNYSAMQSVKFNLEEKYSELIFNIGHVDDTELKGTFVLQIFADKEMVKEIVCNADTDVDLVHSVPLDNARILTLKWYGDGASSLRYGLTNIKVK